TSRILKIGLSSEKLSQMEMTTVAKWKIRPRIMAIPGAQLHTEMWDNVNANGRFGSHFNWKR
ncbi:MAG: hypothetical protein DWQ04_18210, partial [Chloroflexi bacterium]